MAVKAATKIGNKEKALLHVAKAQLGIDEETYRAMLADVGVASSKDLTQAQFDEVMRRMEAGGFRAVHKSARKSGMHRQPPRDRDEMIGKIEAILADLKLPWSYADGIARQMFGVEKLRFCSSDQTYRVMQALIVYQRRQEAASAGQDVEGQAPGEQAQTDRPAVNKVASGSITFGTLFANISGASYAGSVLRI